MALRLTPSSSPQQPLTFYILQGKADDTLVRLTNQRSVRPHFHASVSDLWQDPRRPSDGASASGVGTPPRHLRRPTSSGRWKKSGNRLANVPYDRNRRLEKSIPSSLRATARLAPHEERVPGQMSERDLSVVAIEQPRRGDSHELVDRYLATGNRLRHGGVGNGQLTAATCPERINGAPHAVQGRPSIRAIPLAWAAANIECVRSISGRSLSQRGWIFLHLHLPHRIAIPPRRRVLFPDRVSSCAGRRARVVGLPFAGAPRNGACAPANAYLAFRPRPFAERRLLSEARRLSNAARAALATSAGPRSSARR